MRAGSEKCAGAGVNDLRMMQDAGEGIKHAVIYAWLDVCSVEKPCDVEWTVPSQWRETLNNLIQYCSNQYCELIAKWYNDAGKMISSWMNAWSAETVLRGRQRISRPASHAYRIKIILSSDLHISSTAFIDWSHWISYNKCGPTVQSFCAQRFASADGNNLLMLERLWCWRSGEVRDIMMLSGWLIIHSGGCADFTDGGAVWRMIC